jgi:hypothetical protein
MNHILSLMDDLQKQSSKKKSRHDLKGEVEEEDIEEEDIEEEDVEEEDVEDEDKEEEDVEDGDIEEEGVAAEVEGMEGEGKKKEESSQISFILLAGLYLELSEALFQLSMMF